MPYTTELPQDDQARLVPAVDDREEVPDFDITPAAASKSAELTVDSKIDLAVMPRLFGTLQTIGGIGEMTAASLYISGSGGVGAVLGGGLMLAHGADGAATGIKQLWTGKQQETVTQQMLEPVVGKNIAAISDLALSFCSGGAHIVITSQRNLLMFGKPTTPYLFRVVKELKDKVDDLHFSPEQMPRVSLDQVRAMKGKHKLMYVVTKDGELLMTTNRFAKPMVTASGMKVSYVAHPAIAGTSVPVASAGQIFVRHGKIVKIDNCSGHFRPYGDELKKITEHVFERHGFQEAVGKFTYFGLEKG